MKELSWIRRADLPHDLEPVKWKTSALTESAPETGHYIVEFDMVAEHIAWFEDFGSGTLRHELVVEV